MKDSIIVIPVRMGSKRFPGKPLININGKSMVNCVWENAKKANVGDVIVACCDNIIEEHLIKKKIPYVLTEKNLKSGTDRVYAALENSGKINKYNYVVNLQGDLPNISYLDIRKLVFLAKNRKSKIATLATKILEKKKIYDANIVKVVLAKNSSFHNALYFSRAPIPFNSSNYFEHIGIYAYSFKALKKFISLKQSELEKQESLEQLRALENGFKIDVSLVKNVPFSIDTPKDLSNYLKFLKS